MIRSRSNLNYVNPVCCVATVCHQVRCMYWGHWDYFHRAISHLKWRKIACMRYVACIFSRVKSIDMFSMFLQSGVPIHFLWRFIAVWIYNLTVSCLCMSMLTSNSSGNMQKHGYLGCFHAAPAREDISWVWVIGRDVIMIRSRPILCNVIGWNYIATYFN